MPETKRPLKVFLCHASIDKSKVRELYRYLKRRGIQPWFDEEDLVGGQDWQVEIPKALATSDAIIICLTKNSVDKEGYVQNEIKFALDKALGMPEGRIFLIPIKFEECEVPFSLSRYQWVDLTIEAGYSKMMKALKFRASQLERSTVELSKKTVEEENLAIEKATKEKVEREAIEKAAREKAEEESAEKARLEAEELAKQKVAKEKSEREAAERPAREKTEKEAVKKTRLKVEELAREKADRQAAQKAAIMKLLSNAAPFLKVVGILGTIIVLIWIGSWVAPKFIALVPTPQATTVATQHPVVKVTSTKTPVPPTKTIRTNATPTKTRTPAPASLPTEITDSFGAKMVLVSGGNSSDAFYIDKFEVTNELYIECVRTGGCNGPADTELASITYFGNDIYADYPVVWVTHLMAEKYCEWRDSRLPNGEEWEKASYGKYSTDVIANGIGSDDGFELTAPVGSFPRDVSIYGAYDMKGNVSEHVSGSLVISGSYEGRTVSKGGNWSRDFDYFSVPNSWTGFRCAKDIP